MHLMCTLLSLTIQRLPLPHPKKQRMAFFPDCATHSVNTYGEATGQCSLESTDIRDRHDY